MNKNDITNLEKDRFLVVVGTMKAGKSTLIDAIIGFELLTMREIPMTTLPTIITHKEGQKKPVLKIKENNSIRDIQKKLDKNNVNEEDKKIIELIKNYNFFEEKQGDDVNKALIQFNDIIRIAKNQKLNTDIKFESDELPRIEVEFVLNPKKEGNNVGKFSIVDTPSMNEVNHKEKLREIVKEQLNQASAVLFILDYTQFGSETTQC